jgi:hypothetical protein
MLIIRERLYAHPVYYNLHDTMTEHNWISISTLCESQMSHTVDATQLISHWLYLFAEPPWHSYGCFRYRTRLALYRLQRLYNRWSSAAMLFHVSCGMLEVLINTFVCVCGGLFSLLSILTGPHIYTIQFTAYCILNNMWVHTGSLDGPGIDHLWGRYFPNPWGPASLLYNG